MNYPTVAMLFQRARQSLGEKLLKIKFNKLKKFKFMSTYIE